MQTAQAHPTLADDERRRWLALIVLCAGMLMIILDQTIVNVALPAIQRDLDFTQSSLAWVVNAYMVPFGGLLLLAGRVGDLVGRKRVFVGGLTVFVVTSLLCGLSQNQEMLVVARFVQGIGGAMTSAVILGMIVTLFPDGRDQTRAIGVYSFVGAAGGSIGLLAGGALTQALSWHWIFFVNVPIGVVAVVMAVRLFEPEAGIGWSAGADLAGAALVTSGLMLGVYTVVEAAERGWTSGHTLGLGALAVGLLVGFVVRQATAAQPLLPLGVFRSRDLTMANVVQMLAVAGMFGFLFLSALYLQKVLRYDAIETGLAIMPVALVIGVLSLGFSARLDARFGARNVLLVGLAFITAGLLMLSRVPVEAQWVTDFLPLTIVLGIGAGLTLPALTSLAMTGATERDSGLVSGLFNTTQSVGGAFGLAVLTSLATARSDALLEAGSPTGSALTSGYHLAFTVAAGLVLAGAVAALAVRFWDSRRPQSTDNDDSGPPDGDVRVAAEDAVPVS
jgi:EmrB/QacA subfamily drug resistance transporter